VSADDRIDPEEHVADSRAHQTLKVELAKPAEETSLLLFFFPHSLLTTEMLLLCWFKHSRFFQYVTLRS
jgi:hypothetical protein